MMKLLRTAAAALALGMSAGLLASCALQRTDLFGFEEDGKIIPYLSDSKPTGVAYSDLTSLRVWVSLPLRCSGWTIRYTMDGASPVSASGTWNEYDSGTGLSILSSGTLRVVAGSPDGTRMSGVAAASYELSAATANAVYVDAAADGTGDGSSTDKPLKTVQAGVDAASSRWVSGSANVLVRIKGGNYEESVTMKPGVDLEGSYGAAWESPSYGQNWSSAIVAPADNESTVAMTSLEEYEPSYALYFPSGCGASAVRHLSLQGFGSGSYGSALRVETPFSGTIPQVVLQFCSLQGGGASTVAGAWVRTPVGGTKAGLRLIDCDVTGCQGSSWNGSLVMGILASNAAVSAEGGTAVRTGNFDSTNSNSSFGICARKSSAAEPTPSLSLSGGVKIDARGNSTTIRSYGIDAEGAIVSATGFPTIQAGYAGGPYGQSVGLLAAAGGSPSQPSSVTLNGGTVSGGYSTGSGTVGSDPASLSAAESYSAGIEVTGNSSLSLAGLSSISGGGTSSVWSTKSFGILGFVQVGDIAIRDCPLISGGIASSTSVGLALNLSASSGSILVERSRIWGGTANSFSTTASAGVATHASGNAVALTLRNCFIHGGVPSTYSGSSSFGISLWGDAISQSVSLLCDTVWAPNGPSSVGLSLPAYVQPTVLDCIVLGGTSGVSASPAYSGEPFDFRYNVVNGGLSAYVQDGVPITGDLNSGVTLSGSTALAGNSVSDASSWFATSSVPWDLASFSAFDAHPTKGPAAAGLNLAAVYGFSDDLDGGTARPTGTGSSWYQGAYERN